MLQICLGGCPDDMEVEVHPGVPLVAKTVADLRALNEWSPYWVLIVPYERERPESVVTVELWWWYPAGLNPHAAVAPAAWRSSPLSAPAPARILQGKAGSDDAGELGADFMASPPDHLVFAFPDNTIAGQEEHELIGNVESGNMEPHTALGNVD
jgi:hypothetical protein